MDDRRKLGKERGREEESKGNRRGKQEEILRGMWSVMVK